MILKKLLNGLFGGISFLSAVFLLFIDLIRSQALIIFLDFFELGDFPSCGSLFALDFEIDVDVDVAAGVFFPLFAQHQINSNC